jgi:hypothetical protein
MVALCACSRPRPRLDGTLSVEHPDEDGGNFGMPVSWGLRGLCRSGSLLAFSTPGRRNDHPKGSSGARRSGAVQKILDRELTHSTGFTPVEPINRPALPSTEGAPSGKQGHGHRTCWTRSRGSKPRAAHRPPLRRAAMGTFVFAGVCGQSHRRDLGLVPCRLVSQIARLVDERHQPDRPFG